MTMFNIIAVYLKRNPAQESFTADAAVQATFDDQPAHRAPQLVFPFPPPNLSDEVWY